METSGLLLQLLLILVSARLLGGLAMYLDIPPVVGELLAGILIGPSLLGLVELGPVIHVLAEIGVILLLFDVGLHIDMARLISAGRSSVIVALGGFIGPFLLGSAATYWLFGQPLMVALFVGGTLTATSIGVTVRTLVDINRRDSREGQIAVGASVLDDILGIVLLAALYEYAQTGELAGGDSVRIMLFIGAFLLFAPVCAQWIAWLVKKVPVERHRPGLIPTTIVSLVLFLAWLAHEIGAPELMGGFAAGLALSRRFVLPFGLAIQSDPHFIKRVRADMAPIVQLFTPIFFVSVGLALDLSKINWSSVFFWSFSLVLLLLAVVGKFAGALLIREAWPLRLAVGMTMVPRGEVGLVFAGLGASAGVFSGEIYTALIMVIAYTTLLSPAWLKWYYRVAGARLE